MLFAQGIFTVGTLRAGTGDLPKGWAAAVKRGSWAWKMERGGEQTFQTEDMTVTMWKDSKPVILCSSLPEADPGKLYSVHRRLKGSKDGLVVPCQLAVLQYNATMGSIDVVSHN